METRLDPHNLEVKYKSAIKSIEKSDLSDKNKKIVLKFKEDCVRDSLSKARITKLLENLKRIILALNKDLDKVNKRDIEKFITKIQD